MIIFSRPKDCASNCHECSFDERQLAGYVAAEANQAMSKQ